MLSQFAYDDTDWAMMSSAPDMESGHYFGTDSSGRDLLVRVAIGGRISLMVGVAAALVAVVVGTLYGSLSGYLGGKVDSVMMRLLEILNSFPFMFFVILLVTFFRSKHPADFRGDRHGFLAGYGSYCAWANPESEAQRVY